MVVGRHVENEGQVAGLARPGEAKAPLSPPVMNEIR